MTTTPITNSQIIAARIRTAQLEAIANQLEHDTTAPIIERAAALELAHIARAKLDEWEQEAAKHAARRP